MPRVRLALLGLCALAGACRKSASPPAAAPAPLPPRLVQLRVFDRSDEESGPAVHPDTEALRGRAALALRAAALLPVELGEPPRPGTDYKLDLDLKTESAETDDKGVLRALASARLTRIGGPPGETPIVAQVMAERVYQRAGVKDRDAAARAHAERAVDDVIRQLCAQTRIHLGDASQLVKALADPDTDLRLEAIRVAAERREKTAVPSLLELLKQGDARLRNQALGALVEIGDPSAVPALTRAVHFKDTSELPKVIDAVAALGGDEARAFLEFVSSSHEDPEMRQLASEGLARLVRRHGETARLIEKPH